MLGTTLTKDEVEEFMREADVVINVSIFENWIYRALILGWKRQAGL